jgi:hypothetical protein
MRWRKPISDALSVRKYGTATQNCGFTYNGTCNANLVCVTGGNATGICNTPPNVITQP